MRKLLLGSVAVLAAATCAALSIPLLLTSGSAQGCSSTPASLVPGVHEGGEIVGASIYGGPGDPSSGSTGYRGDTLTGHAAFSELSTNWQQPAGWDYAALGNLPRGTHLTITATYRGRTRSIVATKLDVGSGGPRVDGHPRAIDLWWQTANALGLPGTAGNWTGLLRITRASAAASGGTVPACAATALGGTGLGQRIVAVARAELAKGVSEPGNNCVPYNHCDGLPWCAAFVSYVWHQAGVPMPFTEASNAIWTWANQHTQVLNPTSPPQPGDAILYGTGPASTATSVHVGIVDQVFPDGHITTIEGNLSNRVKRNGPFLPTNAPAAGEPADVYAYARP